MLGAAPLAEVGVKVRGAGARPVPLVGPRSLLIRQLVGVVAMQASGGAAICNVSGP